MESSPSTQRPHSVHILDITEDRDGGQCDSDDNDPTSRLTRLRPWWRLKRFEDTAVERAYCKWHHKLWVPRLQVMYCLTALVYTGGFLTQYLISKDSFRFILSDMRPDLKPVMVTLTAVARVLPCLYAIFMIVPATRKTVTPERYQVFVAATYVVPVIVEQMYPLLSPQLFVITDNITATPRFQSWIEDPSLTVRQTFYHAALSDLYAAGLGALSGLYPESVVLIGVVTTVFNQLLLQNTYLGLHTLRVKLYGGERVLASALNSLWLYRFMTLLWMIAISVMLDDGQRKEFSVRLQLKQQKNLRIEQLKQEKEHLDWDRKLAMAPTQQITPMADASTVASCSELEMVLPQTADDLGGGSRPSGACGGAYTCTYMKRDAPPTQPSDENRASGTIEALGAPLTEVRLVTNLSRDETGRLQTRAALRLPLSSDGSTSDACSNIGENAMGAADLVDLGVGPRRVGRTCAKRESALWRTLQKSGLMSPTPSTASSAPGEAAGEGAPA